jgi:hypothetical protein
MSKYKKGTPQYEKRLAADRERKARKRAEQKAASVLDLQTPPEQIEKAPESAMNQPTHNVGTTSESRILDHEDFIRMSRRHA